MRQPHSAVILHLKLILPTLCKQRQNENGFPSFLPPKRASFFTRRCGSFNTSTK
jgi:hypothetical protein